MGEPICVTLAKVKMLCLYLRRIESGRIMSNFPSKYVIYVAFGLPLVAAALHWFVFLGSPSSPVDVNQFTFWVRVLLLLAGVFAVFGSAIAAMPPTYCVNSIDWARVGAVLRYYASMTSFYSLFLASHIF